LHRLRISHLWERTIEEESSLEVCEFLEAGAFTQPTQQIVQEFQTGSCKNHQLA
jgi:hypothetical protein